MQSSFGFEWAQTILRGFISGLGCTFYEMIVDPKKRTFFYFFFLNSTSCTIIFNFIIIFIITRIPFTLIGSLLNAKEAGSSDIFCRWLIQIPLDPVLFYVNFSDFFFFFF